MILSAAWIRLALICMSFVMFTVRGAILESDKLQLVARRQLSSTCARSEQCSTNQFCLTSARSGGTGACAPCWRCCLFPSLYGNCPDTCKCKIGNPCDTGAECGQGLFCSIEDPWEMPSCQRCNRCVSDTFEIGGSCVLSCPSGDMAALTLLPYLSEEHFLFLTFLAHDISQQGAYAPPVLLKAELNSWVKAQGLGDVQAEMAVTQMLAGGNESVATKSWMEVVSESSSLSFICPLYDPSKPWTEQPKLSFQGCFCNATVNAKTFRCPAGQRCSRDSFWGLETDAPRDPTAQIFRALCVTCEQGQYCPEGTFLTDETQLASLECPAGYYCPTPAERLECPSGSFCTGRTTEPVTCDMQHLLVTDPSQELPMKPDSVIERVRDKRDPLRGNFCPAMATRPNELCSAGNYCPNASSMLRCPKGYYCKAQSTSPWKCPLLTHCPSGTEVPALSFMALVVAGIVICSVPLLQLAFNQLDNSVIMDADEERDNRALHRAAVASRMTFRLLKSIKVNHQSALENKYRGFGTVSPPITMEFDSLGLRIRPRGGEVKNVLMGVSGSFAPRRLNAILGPSGCGKTTFLNVLCGKISNGTLMGQVRINGEDIPIDKLKKIMGFVPQDDIVHEDLTVRENLNYSARLRLPSDMARDRRRDIVHDALEMLGLSAIQHYRVGTAERRGISGGQRKRVNIGLELVAMPSLLFLDEPTSGLDATSSADILDSLVDMANLGMNIIMVIHQPRFSSFLMFDQVLLLGGGGHTVYLGSPSAAMLYFTKYLGYEFPERENPSDILIDIIAGKVPCAGDPRLKNCAQLVEKWTTGGMAWVETLETLNPMMVTKMSEVDPRIILAIDDEFDRLDQEGCGQIHAMQLVSLFMALGQEITVDDAVILIRKINARMPASAKAVARSRNCSPTVPRASGTGADGLTVTKQQLLDAFQNVREANDEGNTDGAVQRNAAAKFYASHFLLPDLPEIKPYREKMEDKRRRHRQYGRNDDMQYSNSGYDSNNSRPGSPSVGYSSRCDNLDSDSYSLVGGQEGYGGYGRAPVMESMMRRSVLAPGGGGRRRKRISGGLGQAGNRTIRAVALLPGLTLNGGSTTSATAGATAVYGDSDSLANGDLGVFAARQRFAAAVAAAAAATPPPLPSQDGKCKGGDGKADADADGDSHDGDVLPGQDSQRVTVSRGVVADSLTAMEALAHADVPLPQLPRKAESRSGDFGGRDRRHSKIFTNIQSYIQAYNELAAQTRERSHRTSVLRTQISAPVRAQIPPRASVLRSHLSVQQAVGLRMQLSAQPCGLRTHLSNQPGAMRTQPAGPTPNVFDAGGGGGGGASNPATEVASDSVNGSGGGGSAFAWRRGSCTRRSSRLYTDSAAVIARSGPRISRRSFLARSAHLSNEEEEEGSDESLPPLLRQLISTNSNIAAVTPPSGPGPVAEGLEGGGEDDATAAATANPVVAAQTAARNLVAGRQAAVIEPTYTGRGAATAAAAASDGDAALEVATREPLSPHGGFLQSASASPRCKPALSRQLAALVPRPTKEEPSLREGDTSTERSPQPLGESALRAGQVVDQPAPQPSPQKHHQRQQQQPLPTQVFVQPFAQSQAQEVNLSPERVPRLHPILDPDLDPDQERAVARARHWQYSNIQTQMLPSRRMVAAAALMGDGSEASRESINELLPQMLPLATSPLGMPTSPSGLARAASTVDGPARVSEGRQWRRFGTSLPRGAVGVSPGGLPAAASGGGSGGDAATSPDIERSSRSPRTRASRFAARQMTANGEAGGTSASPSTATASYAVPTLSPPKSVVAAENAVAAAAARHQLQRADGDAKEDTATVAAAGIVDADEYMDGGATPTGSGGGGGESPGRDAKVDRGSNMDPVLRLQLHELRNNSAPLPNWDWPVAENEPDWEGPRPNGTGRPRRSSFGPMSVMGTGRKPRRHSWLQNGDCGVELLTPGGTRKARKDTLYVNNLLSNALLGAWAATQSVTQGRSSMPLARLMRGTAGSVTASGAALAAAVAAAAAAAAGGGGGGGSPIRAGAPGASSHNTPVYGTLRTTGINRSIASVTGTNAAGSAAPSPTFGIPLNSTLANRLDMEEALGSRKSQYFTTQMLFLLRRGGIKYVRSFWPMRVVDTLLQLAAAFIIGLVHGTRWGITAVPSNAVMCMVCLGVLSCVTHLRTFSNNRVLLWRECASGMSILSYFLSQNIIDQLWVLAAPALSLGAYYYLTLPRMPFAGFYIVGFFVCWWASGMAYLVSAILPPQNVLMAGVFISLIFGAFLNGLTYSVASARSTLVEGVMAFSYNRWAMEIVSINELRNYQYDHRNTIIMMGKSIGLCNVDTKLADDGQPGISPAEAISFMELQYNFDMDGYCNRNKSIGYVALFCLGLGFRILAFAFLRYSCVRRH